MERKELLGWNDTTLSQPIDDAVEAQIAKSALSLKVIPLAMGTYANGETVPAEKLVPSPDGLTIDQTASPNNLSQILASFAIRQMLVKDEATSPIIANVAISTATAAAQGMDSLVLNGASALTPNAQSQFVFSQLPQYTNILQVIRPPLDNGLLLNPTQSVPVPLLDVATPDIYGINLVRAVAQALGIVQQQGFYHEYRIILPTLAFADSITAIDGTTVIPADMMKWIVTETDAKTNKATVHYYGSGLLPPKIGVFFSISGGSMDLVQGPDQGPTVQVLPEKNSLNGNIWPFVLKQTFALRVKQPQAIVQLKFQ